MYIYFLSNFFPILVITEYWAESPVLCSRSLLVIYVKYSSIYPSLKQDMATQSSILACEIPMDKGAWWITVHGVIKSRTQLSDEAKHSTVYICQTQLPIYPFLPSLSFSFWNFNFSQHQRLFQWVSSSYQMAKVLEFQLEHQSFQWILRTDFLYDYWSDLLAVQGTLKSFLQQHSSKASILWHSAFFIVQLSHPCMTTAKSIAFSCQQSNVSAFNMLSRFVIAFLPRSKCI